MAGKISMERLAGAIAGMNTAERDELERKVEERGSKAARVDPILRAAFVEVERHWGVDLSPEALTLARVTPRDLRRVCRLIGKHDMMRLNLIVHEIGKYVQFCKDNGYVVGARKIYDTVLRNFPARAYHSWGAWDRLHRKAVDEVPLDVLVEELKRKERPGGEVEALRKAAGVWDGAVREYTRGLGVARPLYPIPSRKAIYETCRRPDRAWAAVVRVVDIYRLSPGDVASLLRMMAFTPRCGGKNDTVPLLAKEFATNIGHYLN